MREGNELCVDCRQSRGPGASRRTARALVLGAILWGVVGGCESGKPTPAGTGDGGDTDGTPPRDGPLEASFRIPSCQVAATVCDVDGLTIRACVQGQAGDIVDVCDGTDSSVCSFGRCTSLACATAEQQDGARGCRFYGVQSDNIDSDDGAKLMLILTSASDTPANVTVELRAADEGWQALTSAVVPAWGGARIELNRPARESGITPAGAFRVTSDSPVMAVQVESDDLTHASSSSAGTVLRPLHALGMSHFAVTSPGIDTADVMQTPGSRAGAAAITVVATVDGTHVHLGLTAPFVVNPGIVLDPTVQTYDATMDEGDVLQIFSATPSGDLTGSSISADWPVAVFSGNIFTTYGYALDGFNGGDMAEEQLPPVVSWGQAYVVAWLSPQDGCDSFFGPGFGRWEVVAAEDDTDVTVTLPDHVLVDLPNLTFHLNQGEFQSFYVHPDVTLPATARPLADFVASSSKPILLAQWLDCEPGLSWGIDTRLVSTDAVFALPPAFDHQVVVVRGAGTAVTFDGQPLANDRFTPASDDDRFEVTRLNADDLGPCVDLLDRCEHRLTGSAIGLGWRGMDVVCSYSLTVPPTTYCALPGVSCAR
jgi:hypothetical protein